MRFTWPHPFREASFRSYYPAVRALVLSTTSAGGGVGSTWRTVLRAACIAGLLAGRGQMAVAEDWPQFRGPTGQGISQASGLPADWSLQDNTRWKAGIPGKGWSSPIVHAGKVYLTTAVESGEDSERRLSLRALCLDAGTGQVEWNVEVFARPIGAEEKLHKKNSFASATPLTDGQHLFVHFGPDGTACLDLAGKSIWKNQELRFNPQHGNGGSPILTGDLLFFHCDGVEDPFVAALRRDSGELAWRTSRQPIESQRFSFATPLEIEVDGRRQLISPASSQICSYDPESGRELWRVRVENKWSVVPRPVYAHGFVFACTGYEGPAEILAIRPDGQGDVTDSHVVWRSDDQIPHNPSPLIVGDELFLVSDSGIASCRDAQTGKLHWRQRLGGNFSASPVYADGRIYLQSEQGDLTVIAANREKFEKLQEVSFDDQMLATLAIADGALFVRTETRLYRIE